METQTSEYKAELIGTFLQERLVRLRETGVKRPLVVSLQGPQGAGKSTLTAILTKWLGVQDPPIQAVVTSQDDFYLPYDGLKALSAEHPGNDLLTGRGPPGTHDLDLLASILDEVKDLSPTSSHLSLPIFDKSQHDGFGDRSTSTVPVSSSIDIFILEGWSIGFSSLSSSDLYSAFTSSPIASRHSFSSIQTINDLLGDFAARINRRFDCHVGITPESYEYVYQWRTQAERKMKATNGGKGMSDEQVQGFVDRYMPCYELYGGKEVDVPAMTMIYGSRREVLGVTYHNIQ